MAYEKTWQYAFNTEISDWTTLANQYRNIVWMMKALLTGGVPLTDQNLAAIGSPQGLWTVEGSSDGVTGAMDLVDRWGTPFNAAKIVNGSSTSVAHAWVVLKSPASMPGGPLYLIIDYYSSSGQAYAAISYGRTRPTAATPATYSPVSTDNSGYVNCNFADSVLGKNRLHLGLTTDGTFFILTGRAGSGVLYSVVSFLMPVDRRGSDTAPGVVWANGGGSSAFLSTGFTGSNVKGRSFDNLAAANACVSFPLAGGTMVFNACPSTGDRQAINSFPDFPLYVWDIAAASWSYRGRIADIMCGPPNRTLGSVEPLTGGVVMSCAVGELWFPANIAPLL